MLVTPLVGFNADTFDQWNVAVTPLALDTRPAIQPLAKLDLSFGFLAVLLHPGLVGLVGPGQRAESRRLLDTHFTYPAPYTYDVDDRMLTAGSTTFTYDANGDTLSDPSGKAYTWDFENRLVQAVVPGTNGGTTTFKYDPFGRRIQKSGPLGTTNYLYDGINLLVETDSAGNVLAKYSNQPGIDQPLSELRSGSPSYYEQDTLGSVTSLSDVSGVLANTYTFDGFGKQTSSSGSLTNPFRYTGREFDQETGIDYYRFRYYDPSVGRFISEDPIRYGGGGDFYAYVGNNATSYIDPSGLSPSGPPGPPPLKPPPIYYPRRRILEW
jgi:RHS repeat-associated protein